MTAWIDKPGIAPPEFEEITGAAVMTFRVRVAETAGPEVGSKVESRAESPAESQPESPPEWRPESRPESSTSPVPVQFQPLEDCILASLRKGALPIFIISKQLGQERVSGQLKVVLKTLLLNSLIEFTIPDKPNSRLQRYRLTEKGRRRFQ